jgi:pyruvate/2-oxoglutarate dehydrogenase complex dihydrolipoamide dehydrogenase (E3) component
LCTACIPKKTLESHAKINEHMQNLMNTMAASIKSMQNHLKHVKISQHHLKVNERRGKKQ